MSAWGTTERTVLEMIDHGRPNSPELDWDAEIPEANPFAADGSLALHIPPLVVDSASTGPAAAAVGEAGSDDDDDFGYYLGDSERALVVRPLFNLPAVNLPAVQMPFSHLKPPAILVSCTATFLRLLRGSKA